MSTKVPNWSSPARWLVPRVPRAPKLAAPERAASLDEMIAAVRLSFPDSGSFECEYQPDTKIVVISRKALEIVWASSYAYFLVYQRVFEQSPRDQHVVIDLHADQTLGTAVDLLLWAHRDWLSGTDTPWPASLPQPTQSTPDGSIERYATGIFDIAIAYLLHHELAHHRLRHSGSEHEAERDADYEAASWLLDGLGEKSSAFQYRSYGIATVLGILSARAIHREVFASRTHPRAFDRLFDTLSRFISDGHHPAWRMAVVILRLHLEASRIQVPVSKYRDARECVNAYVEVLAEWVPPEMP